MILRLEGYGSFCMVKYDSSYVSQGALRGALRGVSSALGDYIKAESKQSLSRRSLSRRSLSKSLSGSLFI